MADFTTTSSGFLTAQQDWLTGDAFPVSMTTGVVNSVHGAFPTALGNANHQLAGLAGFNPALPWTITAVLEFHPVADNGGTMNVTIGDDAGGTLAGISLNFSAGDGAADQVTDVDVISPIASNSAGPFAFPADATHTVIIHFDGTNLTTTVNGSPGPGLTGVDLSAVIARLNISGIANTTSDRFTYRSITVAQA